MSHTAISLIGLTFAFQIFVSFRLGVSSQFTASQKIAQTCLIWLLPVVGALVVYLFLWNDISTLRTPDRKFVPQDERSADPLSLYDLNDQR